jgi:hypothetical protein
VCVYLCSGMYLSSALLGAVKRALIVRVRSKQFLSPVPFTRQSLVHASVATLRMKLLIKSREVERAQLLRRIRNHLTAQGCPRPAGSPGDESCGCGAALVASLLTYEPVGWPDNRQLQILQGLGAQLSHLHNFTELICFLQHV